MQSAQLTAPAAYWAAWADALPALHARVPRSAASYVQLLEAELGEATHCLAEAANARRLLLDRGWSHFFFLPHVACDLGRRPPRPHAGAWLTAIPCENTTTLPPQAMQVALRRRLRLALPLCASRCGPNPGCGEMVDALGDHALACPDGSAGQTCQDCRAGMGTRRPRGRGCRRTGRAATMARPHDRPRRPLGRPQAPRPRCLWCHCPRRRALLRCDPGVPPYTHGSPAALHRRGCWGDVEGRRAPQKVHVSRACAGSTETVGPRLGDRRTVE